jgi:hypothetical protein
MVRGGLLHSRPPCVAYSAFYTGIVAPIVDQTCPTPTNSSIVLLSNATCPITDPNLKDEGTAVVTLTLFWVGYPLVAMFTEAHRLFWRVPSDRFSPAVSLFKDLSYATLDVSRPHTWPVRTCV